MITTNLAFIFGLTQLTLFGLIGTIGFAYLLITFLFGGLGDDAPDVDHSIDGDHLDHAVSIFSPRIIAIFFVGFGGIGVICTSKGLGAISSTFLACFSGVIMGAIGIWFLTLIAKQQGSSEVNKFEAIGKTTNLALEIPANGMGTLTLIIKGQLFDYTCRSIDGSIIPKGTLVEILNIHGSDLIVKPVK